jgi:hypothetical protein
VKGGDILRKAVIPLIILAILILVGTGAVVYQKIKGPIVPDVPPEKVSKSESSPRSVVKAYEEAIRKKDAKRAWSLWDEEQRMLLDYKKFEKGVKSLPANYKRFKIVEERRAKKHKLYKKYLGHMDKKLLDRSWFVTVRYPDIKSSKGKQSIFLVIPRGKAWRILDIQG